MSGFASISDVLPHLDSGKLRPEQYTVAVKVWFTARGHIKPLSFKFEGEDGSIQYVKDISVDSYEDRYYSGIPSMEFHCQALIGGITQHFSLLYYPDNSKWAMVIK